MYFSSHKTRVMVSLITLWMTSVILTGCLEVPSLRYQASSSTQDLGEVADETRDRSVSCEEYEAGREGECPDGDVDSALPDVETPDATLTCDIDHGACLDLSMVTPTDFTNTTSLQLNRDSTLIADELPSRVFGRAGDDPSDTDAWTISFYFNNDGSGASSQSIMYYRDDREDGLHIAVHLYRLRQDGIPRILLSYGIGSSDLRVQASREIISGQWYHVMLTYEGEAMRPQVGVADRIKIFINGVEEELSSVGLGTNYSVDEPGFKVGQYHPSLAAVGGAKIDEIALWESDQSMNIDQIYHNGSPRDLRLLTSRPAHWWRMGDEDQIPTLSDQVGAVTLQMSEDLKERNLVNDVP